MRTSFWHFFGEPYLKQLDGKKGRELFAVYNFLLNESDVPVDKGAFVIDPPEPVDIAYKQRKFQVTTGSPDSDAVVNILQKKETAVMGTTVGNWIDIAGGRARSWHRTSGLEDGFNDDIIRPIQNKIEQYGANNAALNDITLLVYSYGLVVAKYQESFWQSILSNHSDFFKSAGFKDIYWADNQTNVVVYQP